MGRRGIAGVVVALGVALLAVFLVQLAIGAEADYAALVPAPDSINLREGEEAAFWLSTNRHAVELRIDSIDVGLGVIHYRGAAQGQTATLGHSTGCLDWAVSHLEIEAVGNRSMSFSGTVDRGSETGELTVHTRLYSASNPTVSIGQDIKVSGPSDTDFSVNWSLLSTDTDYVLEASHNDYFSGPETRSVTFTTGDADSGTSETAEEKILLIEGSGIGLIGCHEHDDVVVTLHGENGAELARYKLDVLAAEPANTAPQFATDYVLRVVCVDSATTTADYFDAGEEVGDVVTATDADSATLSYALAPESGELDYAYFEIDNAAQITVSSLGADGDSGLGAERLYTFLVVADDSNGGQADVRVIAQVKLSESSTGDGSCS